MLSALLIKERDKACLQQTGQKQKAICLSPVMTSSHSEHLMEIMSKAEIPSQAKLSSYNSLIMLTQQMMDTSLKTVSTGQEKVTEAGHLAVC